MVVAPPGPAPDAITRSIRGFVMNHSAECSKRQLIIEETLETEIRATLRDLQDGGGMLS